MYKKNLQLMVLLMMLLSEVILGDTGQGFSPIKLLTTISSITLIAPNGGEKWIGGEIDTIKWVSVNISKIKIEYTTDNGTTWIVAVASLSAVPTNYAWKVNATPSTQCKLRISSITAADTFDVSDNNFIIIIEKPLAPILAVPLNNSIGNIQPIIVKWKTSLRVENYRLQLSEDNLFTTLLINDSTLTDTTKQLPQLSNLAKYYWRVKAKNEGGESNWSTVWNFKTLGVPTTVNLLQPENGAVNQPLGIDFKWSKAKDQTLSTIKNNKQKEFSPTNILSISNYWFELTKDTASTVALISDSTVADTLKTIANLEHFITYYWRVKSMNQAGWNEFTNWNNFTTVIVMPKPLLTTPLDSSANISLSPTLIWEVTPTATKYRLQVSIDSLFNTFAFNDSTITNASKQITGLKNNERYYWRIQAFNVEGWREYSATRLFYTIVSPPVQQPIISGNQIAVLSWTQAYGTNLINYKIYRAIGQQTFAFLDSVSNTQLTYKDSGLVNDINYKYKIKAKSKFNTESDFSNEVSSMPFNKKPTANALSNVVIDNYGRTLEKELTFNSSGSIDEDGQIDSVFWFINKSLIQANKGLSDLTKKFSQGTSLVELVVQDNQGAKDTSRATVEIKAFKLTFTGNVSTSSGLSIIGDSTFYAVVSGVGQSAVYRLDYNGNIVYPLNVNGNILSSSSISSDTTVFISSTDYNLYAFSKNGASLWLRPLGGQLLATPTIDPDQSRIYLGVSNNLFFSVDKNNGQNIWNMLTDGPIKNSAVITKTKKLVFTSEKGTIYGVDLNNLNISGGVVTPTWILTGTDTINSPIAIDQFGDFYFGTKSGKLKKVNFENDLTSQLIWSLELGGSINASPVIDGSGNIYVGSSNGNFYRVDQTEGTIKWTLQTKAPILTTAAISNDNQIYFGNTNGEIYAVDSNKTLLWYYKDKASISSSLAYSKGTLYFGTSGGDIIALYDNSNNAAQLSLPIWPTFQSDNRRSGSGGIQLATSISKDENKIPTNYSLEQNFPNPFNPSTVIKYALSFDSKVLIKIYNVLGQDVKLLKDEIISAGNYEVQFNSSTLPSGVYFYRLSAESLDGKQKYSSIKKMILLK